MVDCGGSYLCQITVARVRTPLTLAWIMLTLLTLRLTLLALALTLLTLRLTLHAGAYADTVDVCADAFKWINEVISYAFFD